MKRCWLLVAGLAVVFGGCKGGEKKAAPQQQTSTSATTTTAATTASAPATEAGAMMPAYESTNLDGTKFDLAAHRDKVVLLNLWATWCPPCVFEIPELQRMHNQYASRGFEVVGVSVDQGDTKPVRDFVAEHKMTYPIVHDSEEKLSNILEASVLPTSVLIGRDGRILYKKIGAIFENDPELKAAIEKAL
ncbi:MAG TPA: TlpA disulfide reductase family protein [Thermoanaerobaculia bacterium]|nr:TlpA disulfide reductase family protein [Thermoanaerobaculia bacterium]